jgi:hypothetical protein
MATEGPSCMKCTGYLKYYKTMGAASHEKPLCVGIESEVSPSTLEANESLKRNSIDVQLLNHQDISVSGFGCNFYMKQDDRLVNLLS